MKVIIDISEDYYEIVKHDVQGGNDYLPFKLIAKGTPLPKGHGRLIDAGKIGLTNFECFMCHGDYKEALKKYIEKIENAPTVVEADKEAEE